MKEICGFLLCCFAFCSCLHQPEKKTNDLSKSSRENTSKRDRSITASNSYSDLFLDSLATANFVSQKKIPDSIADKIVNFYNERNYEFAWFTSEGLTEQARRFWNLHEYAVTYEKDSSLRNRSLQKQMIALTASDTLSGDVHSKRIMGTEITLTEHFILYMLHHFGADGMNGHALADFVPAKKQDVMNLADSLVNKGSSGEQANPSYVALKKQLASYYAIARNGGWPQVPLSKKILKKGLKSPAIPIIKKILASTGDLKESDVSVTFTEALESAVKSFQSRFGYSQTGMINVALLREMNVPVIKRLKQILVNMDRVKWTLDEPKGRLIVVNIPEFVLHVTDGSQKIFDMDVVVGKEGNHTTLFNGNLNQVVFSPYWNVPGDIVETEIMPEIEKDKNYLEKQDMEVMDTEDGIPVIRQKPGPKNSLGKVKFLFPNSFNIYFHDTPSKSLFERDKRAYSHGCIRLKDPEKMAMYVLSDQPDWTRSKIEDAMNAEEEKSVRVLDPIPVMISYYTAWVDAAGRLSFREDIYGHDKSLGEKMFL